MLKKILIFLINIYQKLSVYKPKTCRFYPTCSQYMIEAIQKYGAFKGFLKGIWRILRCNPFSSGGYDPVD